MAGSIEIQKYVPPILLKKDVGDMDIDEFLEYLTVARYVQELEKENIMRAISEILGTE